MGHWHHASCQGPTVAQPSQRDVYHAVQAWAGDDLPCASQNFGCTRAPQGSRFLPEVPLSYEEFLNLYYATDGFCEYSGRAFDNTEWGRPSPDRIDSSKGYVEGNVAWVRWGVNKAKQDMPLSAFREVCLDVATARLGSGRAAVWERVRSLDTLS